MTIPYVTGPVGADQIIALLNNFVKQVNALSSGGGAAGATGATGATGAAGATGATGGGGLTATINLTAGQIATLHSIPVQAIAAPGAGKIIVVDAFLVDYKFNSVAFTGGGDPCFYYNGSLVDTKFDLSNSTLFQSTESAACNIGGAGIASPAVIVNTFTAEVVNVALMFADDIADYAAGNGTCRITFNYHTITIS